MHLMIMLHILVQHSWSNVDTQLCSGHMLLVRMAEGQDQCLALVRDAFAWHSVSALLWPCHPSYLCWRVRQPACAAAGGPEHGLLRRRLLLRLHAGAPLQQPPAGLPICPESCARCRPTPERAALTKKWTSCASTDLACLHGECAELNKRGMATGCAATLWLQKMCALPAYHSATQARPVQGLMKNAHLSVSIWGWQGHCCQRQRLTLPSRSWRIWRLQPVCHALHDALWHPLLTLSPSISDQGISLHVA